MSESIENINRQFAQSQARSEARRNQPRRRFWRGRIVIILLILVIVGAAILVAIGAIKL